MQNIIDKSATQQSASIASQGVVSYAKEIISEAKAQKKDKSVVDIDDSLKYILDSESSDSDAGMAILKSHVAKMMDLFNNEGVFGAKERHGKADNDDGITWDENKSSSDDSVRLSSEYSKRHVRKHRANMTMNFEAFKDLDAGQKQVMKEYSAAYFSYLFSDDPKSFERMKRLEAKLKEDGIPESKIISVQKEIKNSARAEIASKVKENMMLRDLSEDLESKLQSLKATSITDGAFGNKKLGGWDFGGYNKSLQGTVDRMNYENAKEFSRFSLEQLEADLISKLAKGEKNIDDLKQVVELAGKTGVDVGEWLEKVWMKRKENLGFVPVDLPEKEEGKIVSMNVSDFTGGKNDGDPDWDREKTEAEELTDKLRALYMHRLIKGDAFTHFSTMFEIRKCKNGLIRLGLYGRSFEEKVSFEAEVLARKKVLEMLEEAFLEDSTFYKKKVAGFLSNERKIKILRAAAERLGLHLEEGDLAELKSRSHRSMLKVVESQIDQAQEYLKTRKSVKAQKVLGKMKALRERLVREVADAKEKPEKAFLEANTAGIV